MAVDVDPSSLTDEQKAVLKAFTKSGGTLLTGSAELEIHVGEGRCDHA